VPSDAATCAYPGCHLPASADANPNATAELWPRLLLFLASITPPKVIQPLGSDRGLWLADRWYQSGTMI
jgi:hypothetical protein